MPLIQQINQRRNLLAHEGLNGPWLVVFDIDSTLMNTAPRNMAILKEAAGYFPALKTYLNDIREEELGWNIRTPLLMAGLKNQALLEEVFQFWKDRFFTDPYLLEDRPYPGAAEILYRLTSEGFTLVYLTGRHVGGMDKGTRESFIKWGFPVDEPAKFFFKPAFEMEDHRFKREACADLRKLGTVTAFFENEPANANLLKEEFPNALGFFLDTITSPDPEPLHPGFIRLDRFG
jgi:hypothetical protein